MNKAIHSIEFVLENCESIIVPIHYIIDISLRDICNNAYMTLSTSPEGINNVIYAYKTVKNFEIKISDSFATDKSLQTCFFSRNFLGKDKYTPFQRLWKIPDITSINILYTDYSVDRYYVMWPNKEDMNNIMQHNTYDNQQLIISIKESNTELNNATSNI